MAAHLLALVQTSASLIDLIPKGFEMGLIGANIVGGIRTTDFYPPNSPVPGSLNAASGNVSQNAALNPAGGNVGEQSALPALWWVGILIALVALRVAYEFS